MKTNRDQMGRFLLLCGVFAPIMMMIVIFVLGQITPNYNPFSDSVCQMGTPDKPYAIVLNAGYIAYGILMSAAAYGLYRSITSTTTAKRMTILLCIHAAGTLLLGVFPDSLDLAQKHLTDDLIHNIISAVSYVPLLVGIFIFRKVAYQETALKAVGILGIIVVLINLPVPVINMFGFFEPISGLLQRVLVGASFSWLALTFFFLYRKRYRL